ncbi:MAG: hypothetical protein IJ711_11370 [Lachnospiraceae bacterium]|nr:hypothetical protein [Lachnospiraceae bacterium]
MRTIKKSELLMYLSILFYCTALFLKRVNLPFEQNLYNKAMMLAAVIALFNIVFDSKMGLRQILFTAFLGGLLFVDSIPTGNHEIFYLFLIIWGCRNMDAEKVIRFIFGIVFVLTLCVAAFTFLGVIENNVHITNDVRKRYDMGYSVWSILPFQYLSLSMMSLYLSKKKVKPLPVVLLIGIGGLIGILTDVKSACLINAIGLIGLYFAQYIKIRRWNKLRIFIWIPELLTLLSYVAVKLYDRGIGFFARLNVILNYRLMYPAMGLEQYGIHLFSNPDVQWASEAESYFGIDNCYLNVLVTWGVVGLLVVLCIYSFLIDYCIKKEDLQLFIITMMMVFVALMWSRLLVLIEAEILICYSDVFLTPFVKKRDFSLTKKK